VIRLKILARKLGVASVDLKRGELVLTAGPATRIDPQRLVQRMLQAGAPLRVTPDQRILAPAPKDADPRSLLEAARQLLSSFGAGA
jgi:transcription-repair coupling factor (superfamily II helicase)